MQKEGKHSANRVQVDYDSRLDDLSSADSGVDALNTSNNAGSAGRHARTSDTAAKHASASSTSTSVPDYVPSPVETWGYYRNSTLDHLRDRVQDAMIALSAYPRWSWAILVAVVVLLAAALMGIGFCTAQSISSAVGGNQDALEASDTAAEDEAARATSAALQADYLFKASDFSQISGDASLSGFSLSGGIAPELSEEHASAINSALEALVNTSDTASAGFVFVDTETGQGFSYNADNKVYGASSFKGPFAAYVCERLIETGQTSLDANVGGFAEGWGSYYFSGDYQVGELIEASILHSDNAAFGSLRENFSGTTDIGDGFLSTTLSGADTRELFRSWLKGMGADTSIADDEEWFPFYTARDAARLWGTVKVYLDSDTETSQFLAEQLGNTATSFTRDALKDTGATVLDKAGWYDDFDYSSEYNSVCDNAIVSIDGHSYVLCIMTSAMYSDDSVQKFEDLVRAIVDARGDLEQNEASA